MNFKRGLKVAGIFAIFGFIFGLSINKVNPFNAPGILLLRIFWSNWEIGHGSILFNIISNPLCYAVGGFGIGLFTKSIKGVYVWLFVLFIYIFSFNFFVYTLPKLKMENSIKREHQNDMTDRLEKDPNDIYALHALGVKHFTKTLKFDEAEKYFQKVISIERPTGIYSIEGQRCLLYLALIYQSRNEKDKAEDYYKQFMATNPNLTDDLVFLNYSNVYLRKNNLRTSY